MTIQYGDTKPGSQRLTRTWIDTAGNVTHSTLDYSSSSAGWLCRVGEGERGRERRKRGGEGNKTSKSCFLCPPPCASDDD
jgi:hypothetical protein